jgi:hypothetical protein
VHHEMFHTVVGEHSRWRDIWSEVPLLFSRSVPGGANGGISRYALCASIATHAVLIASALRIILIEQSVWIVPPIAPVLRARHIEAMELPYLKDTSGTPSLSVGKSGSGSLRSQRVVVSVYRAEPLKPHISVAEPAPIIPLHLPTISAISISVPQTEVRTIEPITVRRVARNPESRPHPVEYVSRAMDSNSIHTLDGLIAEHPALPVPGTANPVSTKPDPKPSGDVEATVIETRADADVLIDAASTAGKLSTSPTGNSDGGTGSAGKGSGADKAGTGPGRGEGNIGTLAGDMKPSERGNTSSGPGGAGNSETSSGVPGVSVQSSTIYLGSFGPPQMGKSNELVLGPRHNPPVVIVGTGHSASALGYYGYLHGRCYTIYLQTTAGAAVLEFAETSGASSPSDLIAPEPLETSLPQTALNSRFVVAAKIDTLGRLVSIRLLSVAEAEREDLLRSLASWRFRPALRGDKPAQVDVLLGLNMTTASK